MAFCDFLLGYCGLILPSLSVYQRQWKSKADLLKKKILQLSRDEGNKELSEFPTQQNAHFPPLVLTSALI